VKPAINFRMKLCREGGTEEALPFTVVPKVGN